MLKGIGLKHWEFPTILFSSLRSFFTLISLTLFLPLIFTFPPFILLTILSTSIQVLYCWTMSIVFGLVFGLLFYPLAGTLLTQWLGVIVFIICISKPSPWKISVVLACSVPFAVLAFLFFSFTSYWVNLWIITELFSPRIEPRG